MCDWIIRNQNTYFLIFNNNTIILISEYDMNQSICIMSHTSLVIFSISHLVLCFCINWQKMLRSFYINHWFPCMQRRKLRFLICDCSKLKHVLPTTVLKFGRLPSEFFEYLWIRISSMTIHFPIICGVTIKLLITA